MRIRQLFALLETAAGHAVDPAYDLSIQKEWRELQTLEAKDWRNETLSAKNRLFKFLTSTSLARFMGIPGRSINLGTELPTALSLTNTEFDHLSAGAIQIGDAASGALTSSQKIVIHFATAYRSWLRREASHEGLTTRLPTGGDRMAAVIAGLEARRR